MTEKRLRLYGLKILALLAAACLAGPVLAQQATAPGQTRRDYSRGKDAFPNIFGVYAPTYVPEPILTNSPRVDQLVRDGKLQISLEDAIALALENNLDIGVQRYSVSLAESEVLRQKSGLGPTRFDPVFTNTTGWERRTIPVNNPFLAGTGVATQTALINYTTTTNFGYSQGLPTGTNFGINWNNNRQSTTSPAQLLNPSVQSTMIFSFSQQLLNGFGFLPNTRFLRVAKNNKRIADLTFSNQVILTVSQVQNFYWDLVFAREDVNVKQRSVELAEKLYQDNKRQVEIGTLAPIEVVRAEAEVARTRQDLIVSQTFLLQQQTLMKNALTKNPLDPTLLQVEVVPTDVIVRPPEFPIPDLEEAVKEAWEKRPDVRQARIDLENKDINARASKNALLPSVTLAGQFSGTGLSGNARVLSSPVTAAGAAVVDANGMAVPNLFVPRTVQTQTGIAPAGLTEAWDRLFGFDFPTYGVQLTVNIPIWNRAAQADNARALLEQRQSETSYRRLQNTVVVEVRNAQISLQQNRARLEAAQKSRELAERTLDAEQKKYQLGASTIFFVIQAQRDLAQAQSLEVRALADLQKSKTEFERAVGRTLEVNRIDISDAKPAKSKRDPFNPNSITAEIVPARGKF